MEYIYLVRTFANTWMGGLLFIIVEAKVARKDDWTLRKSEEEKISMNTSVRIGQQTEESTSAEIVPR